MAAISPPPSPRPSGRIQSPSPPIAPQEGVWSRFFITPLTFISFILSLALIDSRNYNLRVHSRACRRAPPTSTFERQKQWLHELVFKQAGGEAGPYAYVTRPDVAGKETKSVGDTGPMERTRSGCWCETATAKGKSGVIKGNTDERWHWHTMQRKQMRSEVDDAFKLRRWVVLALIVGMIGFLCGLWMSVTWAWSFL